MDETGHPLSPLASHQSTHHHDASNHAAESSQAHAIPRTQISNVPQSVRYSMQPSGSGQPPDVPCAYYIVPQSGSTSPGSPSDTVWLIRAPPDRTKIMIDGFTQLSIIAVFFSSVQSQVLSTTFNLPPGAGTSAANVLIICGILLNVFGAMYAMLSGRWFSILSEQEKERLNTRWAKAEDMRKRAAAKPPALDKESNPETDTPSEPDTLREYLVSMSLYSAVVLVCAGFVTFAAGILVLAWSNQPQVVAIFATCTMICLLLLPMFFLDHRRSNVIDLFNFARYAM